jgi:alkanesulfonate monooxygenase SsuD/methylene tetrahydromethanopterin reductase-like flavin-dependent oxidoreductase (luciferase family)
MKRIWAGGAVNGDAGPMGPATARPGGPELLIGGRSKAALERCGRIGDGYIAGSAGSGTTNEVQEVREYYNVAETAWKDAGRPGKPRFVVALTCAVGAYAAERTRESMRSYYAFRGPSAKTMELPIPYTLEALRDAIHNFEQIGADELILEPGLGDLDQIDRLADVVASVQ